MADLKQLKAQALKHYGDMIAWVETQDPSSKPDFTHMFNAIFQTWYSEGCVYCIEFWDEDLCPIASQHICTGGGSCCDGLWAKMVQSRTWSKWLTYARKVRRYIDEHGEDKVDN